MCEIEVDGIEREVFDEEYDADIAVIDGKKWCLRDVIKQQYGKYLQNLQKESPRALALGAVTKIFFANEIFS